MNKRQVTIFWVIAITLGAAVTAVKLSQKTTAPSATLRVRGQMLFDSFPASDASSIEIQGALGTVTLTKKDGKWGITQRDGYPANTAFINDLIRTLSELKITHGMEAGPSFAPRFGMDETSTNPVDRGLTATFKDLNGKEIAKVSLGKNIDGGAPPSPMGGGGAVGRYVRNHADESAFYAVSEMFPSVSDEIPRWLDQGFISPEKIKSITLSQVDKTDPAWKLSREGEDAEFKLEGASGSEVLDTAATTPLKSIFSYARFEDIVPIAKVAERSANSGKRTVTIETFEGFTYTVTIIPSKPTTPPATTETSLVTVEVAANLPNERKKEDSEKPEDAKTKDTAFTDRLKALSEKLTQEKAFKGITFEVAKTLVDPLLKERDALITKATPPPPPADASATQGGVQQNHPGGIVAGPSASATTAPIEAVTPAISIPPAKDSPKKTKKK